MHWDEHGCRAPGEHEHSGKIGCRVRSSNAARWNETAAERWRKLHRQAYQRCRREGLRPWLLVRVWELQKRGLLHAHPVLAYSTLAEKRGADRYLEHLDAMRSHYGFGYVERKRQVREPRAAAACLSSYFISGKGKKAFSGSRPTFATPRDGEPIAIWGRPSVWLIRTSDPDELALDLHPGVPS